MEPNASDTVQVSLYGYTYTLYTHSFQCYGRNEAEKKLLAMLLQVLSGRESSALADIIVSCNPGSLAPSLLSPFPPLLC